MLNGESLGNEWFDTIKSEFDLREKIQKKVDALIPGKYKNLKEVHEKFDILANQVAKNYGYDVDFYQDIYGYIEPTVIFGFDEVEVISCFVKSVFLHEKNF
jgi:hypothetical protein